MSSIEPKIPYKCVKVPELAQEFHVCERTIWRWMEQGMPYIRVGKIFRFELPSVYTWFWKQRKKRKFIVDPESK